MMAFFGSEMNTDRDKPAREKDSIKKFTRIMGAVLMVGVTMNLVVAVIWTISVWRFKSRAAEAEGTVVKLATDGNVFTPVVACSDRSGVRHQARMGVSSSSPDLDVGDTVPVLYDPADPEDARIDSFLLLWLGPLIFWLLGVGSLAMTLLFIFIGPLLLRWLSAVVAGRTHGPSPTPPRV